MTNKIQTSIIAGLVGTAVMTIVMMIAPLMGMPKMSPPEMLSAMLGLPLFVGWVMHFMIGIIFAFVYTYLNVSTGRVENVYLKGAMFGAVIFAMAQIMMAIMGKIITMPAMDGSIILSMTGSLIGHIIFGMTVSKTVENNHIKENSEKVKPSNNEL